MSRALATPDVRGVLDLAREIAGGLDPRLRYHDARHTFGEVLPAARALAADLGVPADERLLIDVACAFHDLGFRTRRAGHEAESARLARAALADRGFGAGDLERVEGMILATRLPQRPRTRAERIVADADMAILASSDFVRRNEDLRLEQAAAGRPLPRTAWLTQQRRFVLRHRFHTSAATRRWDAAKRRNAARLGAALRTLAPD